MDQLQFSEYLGGLIRIQYRLQERRVLRLQLQTTLRSSGRVQLASSQRD